MKPGLRDISPHKMDHCADGCSIQLIELLQAQIAVAVEGQLWWTSVRRILSLWAMAMQKMATNNKTLAVNMFNNVWNSVCKHDYKEKQRMQCKTPTKNTR